MPRYTNLIFQGGGVKGMCYAGAYANIPENIRPRVVGGASAGSIAAAMIACGASSEELTTQLKSFDVASLIDKESRQALDDIKSIFSESTKLFGKNAQPGLFQILFFLRSQLPKAYRQYQRLRDHYGIVSTEILRDWLQQTPLAGKTFEDIRNHVDDLRIVGSNLQNRRMDVYSIEVPGRSVIDAVVASCSIPFFFRPALISGYTVDGGLLSNFPLMLFQQEPFPTVGFRLFPYAEPQHTIETFSDYLKATIVTSLDALDKRQPRPRHYHEAAIYLPSNISAVDFDLSDDQKAILLSLGELAAKNVDWDRFSSPTALITGIDPHPDHVVSNVIQNSRRMIEDLRDPNLFPQVLHEEVQYTCRITADGTVHYRVSRTCSVKGCKPWMGGGASLDFSNIDGLSCASLADLDWTLHEIRGGEAHELPRFPLKNELRYKAFVYPFVPPIADGQEPRTFVYEWSMPKECQYTLCRGEPDHISYATTNRADKHYTQVEIVLLLHTDLGDIEVDPIYQSESTQPIDEAIDGHVYRKHIHRMPDSVLVPGTLKLHLTLNPKADL